MYFSVKLRSFQGFFIPVWFGVGQVQKTEFFLIWKHWSSLWTEVQCSIIPGIISDVSTQTKPIFGFVFGFNGGYFKKNAFLNIFRKIKKCSHFKTFHIKTKNKTKNWFCLGTNITNDARNDWTLHLHPQRASMFSNERKFSFLDLSNPKPNQNEKSLKSS